jgi:hypothetical protein
VGWGVVPLENIIAMERTVTLPCESISRNGRVAHVGIATCGNEVATCLIFSALGMR